MAINEQFKKGCIPWNKGKSMPESTRQKIRKTLTGRKRGSYSEEHRRKISKAHKGIIPSAETRLRMSKAHKGAKSHFWQGGVAAENHLERTNVEYDLWRKAVFVRDGYTCCDCGQKGGELNAHHIKAFATHPYLRFAIDNGETLCEKCHKKVHFYKGVS